MQSTNNKSILDLVLGAIYISSILIYFRMSNELGYSYSNILIYTDAICLGVAAGILGTLIKLKQGIKINKYVYPQAWIMYWLIFFVGMSLFVYLK